MDKNACLELVELCYRTVEDARVWQLFVERLTQTLSADAGDFVIEDYANGEANALGSVGFDSGLRLSYDEEFLGENPWITSLKSLPKQRAFSNELEPEDFEHSTYYNEWVRPQGFRHAIGGFVEETQTRVFHLGVLRDRKRPPFGFEDARLLNQLFPHVSRALVLSERLKQAESSHGPLATLIDQLRTAAFLVDSRSRVLLYNSIAEDLLRNGNEFRLIGGRLTPWITEAENSLEEAYKRACQIESLTPCPDRIEVVLPKRELTRPPLILDIIPLFGSKMLSPTGSHCLVLISDPSASPPISRDLLQQMWKLTPTEAKLAIALAGGCTTGDFATRSGISIGTARWHLKNLQSKIGVNSIASLVLLVKGVALRP